MTPPLDLFRQRFSQLQDVHAIAYFPAEVKETQQQTDAAVAGILKFRLNGIREITTGWHHLDWKGNHHPYQEWNCQLRRFYPFPPLSWAFEQTRDTAYTETARGYIENWIKSHSGTGHQREPEPCEPMLDLAIRIGKTHSAGWPYTLAKLEHSSIFIRDFSRQVLESIRGQSTYLTRHLAA